MGHLLRAHTFLFALQPGFAAKAATSIAAARGLAEEATPRERLHLAAARAWAGGDYAAPAPPSMRSCGRGAARPDRVDVRAPGRFLRRRAPIAARPAAALAALGRDLPGYGFVQSMLAFGLEEAGDYAGPRRSGARPWPRNPKDVWGIHAVGHVLEMQGRDGGGSTGTSRARPTGCPAATSPCTMPGTSRSTMSTARTMAAALPSTTA